MSRPGNHRGNVARGGSSLVFSAWNSADKHADVTLSGSDRIATSLIGGSWRCARGTLGRSTGKWHIEYQITGGATSNTNFGFAAASQALNIYSGLSGQSLGVFVDKRVTSSREEEGYYFGEFANGLPVPGDTNIVSGSIVAIEVDLDAKRFWASLDGGEWRGASGYYETAPGTPSSGTNGFIFDQPASAFDVVQKVGVMLYPFCSLNNDAVKINTGQDAFIKAVSSGFAAWG